MIRSHRRRHFRVFAALAVVLPLILAAALLSRQRAPVMDPAPTVLDGRGNGGWTAIDSVEAEVGGAMIEIRILESIAAPARLGVDLMPASALRAPDVLVYWSAAGDTAAGSLPSDALLLGSLAGRRLRRFALPVHRGGQPGSLVLYSAAHRAVLGTIALPGARP